jgi:hypothetical protein
LRVVRFGLDHLQVAQPVERRPGYRQSASRRKRTGIVQGQVAEIGKAESLRELLRNAQRLVARVMGEIGEGRQS